MRSSIAFSVGTSRSKKTSPSRSAPVLCWPCGRNPARPGVSAFIRSFHSFSLPDDLVCLAFHPYCGTLLRLWYQKDRGHDVWRFILPRLCRLLTSIPHFSIDDIRLRPFQFSSLYGLFTYISAFYMLLYCSNVCRVTIISETVALKMAFSPASSIIFYSSP